MIRKVEINYARIRHIMKKKIFYENTGMMLVITYFVFLLLNALVLFFANRFFPENIVLGTANIPVNWAILHSMGTLALVNTFLIPYFRVMEEKRSKKFTTFEWLVLYFVVNAGVIWLIARFAEQFGLGISSWRVAVALGLVLDVFQGIAMLQVEKLRVNNK